MTDKEAMKLALDALENQIANVYDTESNAYKKCSPAISALKERLAQPEQEPVAVKRMKEWVKFLKRQSDNGQHMNIPSSFGAGTCWEIAIELEQFINTTSPQRTWVGLTQKEVQEIHDTFHKRMGPQEFASMIGAKLKEKNNE